MTRMKTKGKTLYDALNMKGKNSIYKSVVLTNEKTVEGFPIVEVEPFDNTFLNAIKHPSLYDKTIDKIKLKVFNYFKGKNAWLAVYTDYGQREYLLSEYYMKV